MKFSLKGLFFFLLLWGQFGFAWNFSDLDMRSMRLDWLLKQNKPIHQTWTGKGTHPGVFCDEKHQFEILFKAVVRDIDFVMQDDHQIDVNALFDDMYARASGNYSSDYSLCIPLGGWTGVGLEGVNISAKVLLRELADEKIQVLVHVNSVKFDKIRVGVKLPKGLEKVLTRSINKGLKWIWESSLGEWLNRKISDHVNAMLQKKNGVLNS